MKFLIFCISFYLFDTLLYAQNEHIYKQLSQTYLVHQFPYKVKLPVSNTLMQFQDSILIDIYYYQTYADSKYQRVNKQDSTTIVEYSFKQEGWYQIFVFTKQGAKLYQTTVLLLYKPQEKQKNNLTSEIKSIEFEWVGDAVVFGSDSAIIVHKKKRSYEFNILCNLPDIPSDTLYVNVYRAEKKEEVLFTQWKMIKSQSKYQTYWVVKRKELGKYRLSVFDTRRYWYGSKEVNLQESK